MGGLISPFLCENKHPVKFQNSNWPPSKIFKINLIETKNRPQGANGWGSEFYCFPRIFIIFI
jgi:hypothetical protein